MSPGLLLSPLSGLSLLLLELDDAMLEKPVLLVRRPLSSRRPLGVARVAGENSLLSSLALEALLQL